MVPKKSVFHTEISNACLVFVLISRAKPPSNPNYSLPWASSKINMLTGEMIRKVRVKNTDFQGVFTHSSSSSIIYLYWQLLSLLTSALLSLTLTAAVMVWVMCHLCLFAFVMYLRSHQEDLMCWTQIAVDATETSISKKSYK